MARSNALAGAKSDQRYQWLRNTTPAHIPRNASSDQSLAGAAIGGPGLSTAEISLPTGSGAMIFDRDNALASAPRLNPFIRMTHAAALTELVALVQRAHLL